MKTCAGLVVIMAATILFAGCGTARNQDKEESGRIAKEVSGQAPEYQGKNDEVFAVETNAGSDKASGASTPPTASLAEESDTSSAPWVRIALDKDFSLVWLVAEGGYAIALARNLIPDVGDQNMMIEFPDVITTNFKGELTSNEATERFGRPSRMVEDGDVIWLDYGPIQLKTSKESAKITTFRAQRWLYSGGFVAEAIKAAQRPHEAKGLGE